MRRLIAITLLLIAVPLVLVFGIAANDGGGSGYKVRAIFDFVRAVPGEDGCTSRQVVAPQMLTRSGVCAG